MGDAERELDDFNRVTSLSSFGAAAAGKYY